jgi:hypothetical protein
MVNQVTTWTLGQLTGGDGSEDDDKSNGPEDELIKTIELLKMHSTRQNVHVCRRWASCGFSSNGLVLLR